MYSYCSFKITKLVDFRDLLSISIWRYTIFKSIELNIFELESSNRHSCKFAHGNTSFCVCLLISLKSTTNRNSSFFFGIKNAGEQYGEIDLEMIPSFNNLFGDLWLYP
ncbi:hypothetical protein DMUE_2131 [Dictyocoela muelleri]|nr:hypothetical protein DMUE_2131 [Dictyocoela muelleri]